MAENNLRSVAFPVLNEAQIAQLISCAKVVPRHCQDGEILISVGQRDLKFFIVQSGEIEILDYSGDEPRTLVVHQKGQFTGGISHLTGNPSIISAVARGDCTVYEIAGPAL